MRASTAAAFALRKCCSVLTTTTTTTSTSSRRAIIASNLSTPLLANNSNNARKLFSTFATRRGILVGSTYDSSRSNNTSNPSLRLRCFSSNNNGVLFSSKKTASNASTNVTVTKKKSSPSEAPEQQQSTTATSDEMHFEKRLQDLDRFFAEKRDNRRKYPNWTSTISISDFIAKYKDIPNDSRLENEEYLIAGRVMSKREASSKLVFYSIRCGNTGETLQVMATKKNYQQQQSTADASADPSVAGCGYSDYDEFARINEIIRRGDIIGVRGFPGKTKIGELSIIPQQLTLLAPCLHSLPHDYYNKLEDPETRYRNRYLDLMLNPSVRETFKVRAKAISFIRRFLDSRGFVEVDTPILCTTTGGANAKPFHTHLNARNMDLKLRISPELFLKQLVVGGLDRVYEMGRQFRNEGMDTTHNPEFTTCEYYMAYADNETNMRMTEEMLSEMVKEITGGQLKVPYTVVNEETGAEEQIELDFTPPFRRISYTKHIEERIGRPLPRPDDPDAIDTLLKLCEQHGVPYTSTPATYGRLVDKLASHFVEPLCVQPTFVVDHPTAISPLAKQRPDDATITERFELFVAGKELCNAYSELNDPREQRIRFERQQADRVAGDVEAQEPDETFCRALEYGLPPTGGWGIGVDRLVMLLTNNRHIREVILFPTMKPKEEK